MRVRLRAKNGPEVSFGAVHETMYAVDAAPRDTADWRAGECARLAATAAQRQDACYLDVTEWSCWWATEVELEGEGAL